MYMIVTFHIIVVLFALIIKAALLEIVWIAITSKHQIWPIWAIYCDIINIKKKKLWSILFPVVTGSVL